MKTLKLPLFILLLYAGNLIAQDNVLLHFTFDGNANDSSGNANNGTVHNATLTEDRFGNANSAYDFNGTDSYIDFPASSSLIEIYTSEEVTIMAWINIRNWYQGWNVFPIIEQYNPETDYGSLVFEANWASGGILFTSGYNYLPVGGSYNWDFNVWHHVAVTYKKSEATVKFYVDGNLVDTKDYTENFSPDVIHSFAIGRSLSGPDEYTDGKIDDLYIFNKALTQTEIDAALAAENSNKPKISVYPNPATSVLNVSNFRNPNIKILSADGRNVLSAKITNNKIDVSKLNTGIYYLLVDEKTYKFIKQ